jgi:hemoglobin
MYIAGDEFFAVLDDAMEALARNKIGLREKEEALFVLYSMNGDVVHV